MRSTLFYIPHEIAGVPLFGFGLLLAVIVVALFGWTAWQWLRQRPLTETMGAAPFWLITAAIVVWVLPNVEARWPDGTPIGLPIRGYGVMVLLGLLSGIGICVVRGKQLGIHPDTIIGLGFWMMLGGVLGARLFYVTQKWEEFRLQPASIVMLTEGGLVIYGGVIGGLVAGAIYCYRHQLNVAATADLVAPGFLIGYALGRLGCLLHGCCFGGICAINLPAIEFPHGSGPYQAQAASGALLGLELKQNHLPTRVTSVKPESPADVRGIAVGDLIEAIELHQMRAEKGSNPTASERLVVDIQVSRISDGLSRSERITLFPENLPERSLPVHPSQIYAAINGLLLCLLIWLLQPLPHRDGIAFLTAILLYAISRFLLEGIRSDEAGQLGTEFTIAQLISFASGTVAVIGLVTLMIRPAKRAWDWHSGVQPH